MGSLPEKDFPQVHRFITTHKEDGTPTFETKVPEPIEWERTNIGVDFFLAYTLSSFPAPLSHDADLNQYKEHLVNHPPFMIPGGASCATSTTTQAGELELEVEGGEKRLMKRGDVAVQRGTNHCWRNPSKTQFARALYIAMDAKPVIVNGQALGESLGEVKH
ncbi:cupin domain protein [Aspergillus nomiae NRRL 13137]|uniref:Cupin domain protein n=1 Tax=Aspergillus nomiae NRRL (strain ATCC 15546 / NRRL 13137 / CBS 260.88 / M93) TaxID=1509407 RepID=A0A0L1JJ06_ASPN3|nr:cupin domain protein [Aspergillus nomiae NRRL 13137]KNG91373.1 cupin domain protein [Aspergillus nomiae NRRL 13137]